MFHVEHHDLPHRETVHEVCRQLGVEPGESFYTGLKTYLDILCRASERMNLVGPGEIGRLWSRHVVESLAYVRFLSGRTVVDVGTGAGFPGFVLSLLGYSVTMVESRSRRCGFLETAARECGVKPVVLCERIEKSGPFPSGTQFTSRAVKKPDEMIGLIKGSVEGCFSLLIRVPSRDFAISGDFEFHELLSPPLDRRGFILQYSHSEKQNQERCPE